MSPHWIISDRVTNSTKENEIILILPTRSDFVELMIGGHLRATFLIFDFHLARLQRFFWLRLRPRRSKFIAWGEDYSKYTIWKKNYKNLFWFSCFDFPVFVVLIRLHCLSRLNIDVYNFLFHDQLQVSHSSLAVSHFQSIARQWSAQTLPSLYRLLVVMFMFI